MSDPHPAMSISLRLPARAAGCEGVSIMLPSLLSTCAHNTPAHTHTPFRRACQAGVTEVKEAYLSLPNSLYYLGGGNHVKSISTTKNYDNKLLIMLDKTPPIFKNL